MTDLDWREQAACLGADPDLFYPERGSGYAKARKVCAGCPVRAQCLQWALKTHEPHGMWGGASEKQRRKMDPSIPTARIAGGPIEPPGPRAPKPDAKAAA